MPLIQNTTSNLVLFVTYHGIIKDYRPQLLYNILQYYQYDFKDHIDLAALDAMTPEQINETCALSSYRNILQTLALDEYDWDAALNSIYSDDKNLFEYSDVLAFGSVIKMLLEQKMLKKLFIWAPNYDPRVEEDVRKLYGDNENTVLLMGNFSDCLKDLEDNPSLFVLNDIELLDDIQIMELLSGTGVLVAEYLYNFIHPDGSFSPKTELVKKEKEIGFTLSYFQPYN